jgi:antitoxin VapB
MLIPAGESWESLFNSLNKFSDDFMTERRQPRLQKREDF